MWYHHSGKILSFCFVKHSQGNKMRNFLATFKYVHSHRNGTISGRILHYKIVRITIIFFTGMFFKKKMAGFIEAN